MARLLLTLLVLTMPVQALQILQPTDSQQVVKQQHQAQSEVALTPKQVLVQLKKLAKSGDARAQFSLANMYYHGINVKQDQKLAFYWYTQVAEQGYASAQFALGNGYYHGVGTSKDLSEAAKWFELAAEQDLAEAQYNLAVMYRRGEGLEADDDQAITWYKRAADAGHWGAQLNLAKLYEVGVGTEVDLIAAQTYYEAAAKQNNAQAQFYLADFYERFFDSRQSVALYQQAADQGLADAQHRLASLYQQGYLLEKDEAKAMQWASAAAEQGQAKSQFLLAQLYQHSKVRQDLDQTIHWYTQAANQGHGQAQHQLAQLYLNDNSLGDEQDLAFQLLKQAADNQILEARYQLARLYLERQEFDLAQQYLAIDEQAGVEPDDQHLLLLAQNYQLGRGVAKDLTKAYQYFSQSANKGNADAQYHQALALLTGEGVEKDAQQAIGQLLNLSRQSHALSQYRLYELYHQGIDVAQDSTVARMYLFKAAQGGHAESQYLLGTYYLDEELFDSAKQWLEAASAQQHTEAQARLAVIDEQKQAYFDQVAEQLPTPAAVESVEAPVVDTEPTPTEVPEAPVEQALVAVPTPISDPIPDTQEATFEPMVPALAEIANSLAENQVPLDNVMQLMENAKAGNPVAQHNLSTLYRIGSLVPKDDRRAFLLMRKSAAQGLIKSQNALAMMYLNGVGVEEDYQQAHYWASASARSGDPEGQEILLRILEQQ